MDSLLGDLNFVKVYLDDILIHSESEDQHLEHIKEVMTRLYNSNVSINYEKSEFLIESVSFLGHTISRKGISPNIDRIEPLRKIKPRNKRQIQRVLGILNWYRGFIPNASKKTIFLTEKLKGDSKFTWNKADDQQLNEIILELEKDLLFHTLTMAYHLRWKPMRPRMRSGASYRKETTR